MNQQFFETKIHKINTDGPAEQHPYKYMVNLPQYLHDWDVWDYWEKEQVQSIEQHLKMGDILFDIGAEAGYLSALYAKYIVGGENVIMFEPAPHYWDVINAIWEANGLAKPKGEFHGFVSDKSTNQKQAKAGIFEGVRAYKSLNDVNDRRTITKVTIDDFVRKTGLIPKGIKIDIEGAEFLAIKGAVETMKNYKPLIWISEHPDLILKDYGSNITELIDFMAEHGYKRGFLSTDHETHALYSPID